MTIIRHLLTPGGENDRVIAGSEKPEPGPRPGHKNRLGSPGGIGPILLGVENTFPIGVSSLKGTSAGLDVEIVMLAILRFLPPSMIVSPASSNSFRVAAEERAKKAKTTTVMLRFIISG